MAVDGLHVSVNALGDGVCANYTVIDSRDYALPGIDDKYRGNLSHLVTHAVTQRIDAHMEAINCHPKEIRRYYRRLDY